MSVSTGEDMSACILEFLAALLQTSCRRSKHCTCVLERPALNFNTRMCVCVCVRFPSLLFSNLSLSLGVLSDRPAMVC